MTDFVTNRAASVVTRAIDTSTTLSDHPSHATPPVRTSTEMDNSASSQPNCDAPVTEGTETEVPKPILPSAHILLFAADVYFRFCHNQPYSLFHEGRFRQRLIAGSVPDYLTWAFLASARRFSSFPHRDFEGIDNVTALSRRAWETFPVPWQGPSNAEEALSIMQAIVLIVSVEHPGENANRRRIEFDLVH